MSRIFSHRISITVAEITRLWYLTGFRIAFLIPANPLNILNVCNCDLEPAVRCSLPLSSALPAA